MTLRFSTNGTGLLWPLTILLVLAAIVPAKTASAADLAALRQRLILNTEPAGAQTPTAAKAGLTTTPQAVVIAGRIDAKGMDPFVKGKASFAMLQLPDDHAQKPGHNSDDCPFCKKRLAKAPLVAVQFIDEDGMEISQDARELFGVAKGQEVVVKGMATFNPKLALPIIQLKADGIYIRKHD
jgi:hypothetical protein